MSTILTRKGADYSLNAVKFNPPITSGLLGWWYLGGMSGDDAPTAQKRTLKNLAGTSYVMALAGTPTIATGYVQVSASGWLTTNIPESLDFTLLSLALPIATSSSYGGWQGTGADKNFYGAHATTLTTVQSFTVKDIGGGTHNQTPAGTVAVGAGYTSLRMLSYKINSATEVTSVRDLTDGLSSGVTLSGGVRALCAGSPSLQFGGLTGFTGAARLGFVAAYNRVLLDSEGDTIRAFVAKYRLAKYGDVV